ncbi:aminoglycoside phosphotransferase family protein [Streptosporangium sp. NPDC048047]|uniref:aminoglycoside phosphotransferase family protein n=1 Tax=Streptosporangium sp. NPDC048047 TaxID=3155748 RepID=UPI00342C0123
MNDSDDLIDDLRRLAERHGDGPAEVVPTRPDVVIVRAGSIVVKAHGPGTRREPLELRVRAAAHPALRGIVLGPVTEEVTAVHGRLVTVWPAGTPVDPGDPDAAPWTAAARLLARLHAVPARALPPLPPAGGPARVAATVARLEGRSPAADLVRRTLACLPLPGPPGVSPASPAAPRIAPGDLPAPAAELPGPRVPLDSTGAPGLPGTPRAAGLPGRSGAAGAAGVAGSLAHGDWHMGQLVRTGGEWILIDVDDMGTGDPAWDLARPAAWFAAGLLEPSVWHGFLAAYRAAGGRAAGAGGDDPWPWLDLPAQAMTVQLAAAAVDKADRAGRPLDEVEHALLDTCEKIARARNACHGASAQ